MSAQHHYELEYTAQRSIANSEDLSISYVPTTLDVDERREILWTQVHSPSTTLTTFSGALPAIALDVWLKGERLLHSNFRSS